MAVYSTGPAGYKKYWNERLELFDNLHKEK